MRLALRLDEALGLALALLDALAVQLREAELLVQSAEYRHTPNEPLLSHM